MSTNASQLTKRIQVAARRLPADLVVKNAKIVNVFTGEIISGDIAVVDGMIAGIGDYEGLQTLDAQGRTVVPGFIDGHVHIESSMLLPSEFAKVVLKHGVTAVVTDPHEIANVAGEVGIQYMLDDAERTLLDVFVMLPSCVPATPAESNGATLDAAKLSPFLSNPQVLGLAEVMDFPSVANTSPTMLDKLVMTTQGGGLIDGHAAGIGREDLNIYAAANIRTDHEAVNAQEAADRLNLGMYLMIREGTVAKDLDALLPAVTPRNSRRCLFVTDDKLLDDLIEEGSIDHIVRRAIAQGLDPITAVQMATLNAAECFGLRGIGAVAPGYQADFLLLDDLEQVEIASVYKKGLCVFSKSAEQEIVASDVGAKTESVSRDGSAATLPNLNVQPVTASDISISLPSDHCHVIGVVPGSLITQTLIEQVEPEHGEFPISVERDLLKLVVAERHRATGQVGAAIVKGFELKRGAIAGTVAHDSHNIVAVGASDAEILYAIEQVTQLNGGLVIVDGEEVLASLPLPVAGLMSAKRYEDVYENMKVLNETLGTLGATQAFNPFLMLSFLTLSVIPELKLTDKGLFQFSSNSHIEVSVQEQ